MKLELEPIPREKLPKKLRDMTEVPDFVLSDLYRGRAVTRVESRLRTEFEESLKRGRKVAFSLAPEIVFILRAAAEGVIGNIAFAALMTVVNRIRKPKREVFPGVKTLEQVVSRRTYSRYRLEEHPGKRPLRTVSIEFEQNIETEYRLMVPLKKKAKTSSNGAARK